MTHFFGKITLDSNKKIFFKRLAGISIVNVHRNAVKKMKKTDKMLGGMKLYSDFKVTVTL